MNTLQNTIIIPKKVALEIRWYLRNYNDIEKYIKKREKYLQEEVIDYYHYTNKNYLKSIHSIGRTLENTIIDYNEDKVILKYKKWKHLIQKYMNDIDNKNDFISYWIVRYKFFNKRDNQFIKEHLNLSDLELKQEILSIFYNLYQKAIEEGIYEEVA